MDKESGGLVGYQPESVSGKIRTSFIWPIGSTSKSGACIDQPVELTAQRLPCRLLAMRVPPEVAKERRKRVREAAKASGRTADLKPGNPCTLCDWTILVTNLPSETFAP